MAKRRKRANFPIGSIYPSIRVQQQKDLRKQGGTGFGHERNSYSTWDYFPSTYHKPTIYPSEYSTLRQNAKIEAALKFSAVWFDSNKLKVIRYTRTGEQRLVMLSQKQSWVTCTKFIAVDEEGRIRTFLLDQIPADHLVLNVSIENLKANLQKFATAGAALVEESKNALLSQVLVPL